MTDPQSPWLVDGRYRNVEDLPEHGFGDMRRWRAERRARGWRPTGAPPAHAEADVARIRDPPGPQATWIGHATYLLQLDGKNILTDPVWGSAGFAFWKRASVPRAIDAGLRWADLPSIDLVLVSHNHYDHLDAATVRRLPRTTPIACPSGLGGWFRRRGFREVHEVAWWEATRVAGFDVTSVPAQHWSRRGLFDARTSHWCGWVVDGERRVHFAGDSAYFRGFREIRERARPDVAILPIGAYEPRWFMASVHMNPAEAVRAYRDLGASRFLGMHWGTFRLTDEPLDEPPALVRDVWAKEDLPRSALGLPSPGATEAL